MHVSEVKVAQLCPTLCNPMDSSMEFSRPEYWSGQPFPSPGDLPNPGIKPRSPALQAHSLPAEPQGKPKNMGVGRLSLLQGNNMHSHCLVRHCMQPIFDHSFCKYLLNLWCMPGTVLAIVMYMLGIMIYNNVY